MKLDSDGIDPETHHYSVIGVPQVGSMLQGDGVDRLRVSRVVGRLGGDLLHIGVLHLGVGARREALTLALVRVQVAFHVGPNPERLAANFARVRLLAYNKLTFNQSPD